MSSPTESATSPQWKTSWMWGGIALLVRGLVVLWAADRVAPSADGAFYHVVAERIARGLGYTWAWPDGAVTFAAHYPVGYPALLGGAYALAGATPAVAMVTNALLGAWGCVVVHRLTLQAAEEAQLGPWSRWAAHLGAGWVAVSPTLVAYTAALMTESTVGVLIITAGWLGLLAERSVSRSARLAGWLGCGVVLGAATLVRPQSILLAPGLASLVLLKRPLLRAWSSAVVAAALVSGVALLVCVPWTLRNCERMERCVFVSANGGWNILIGTFPEGNGSFVPIDAARVPPECRTVFAEAEKDACFGRAGRERIARAPGAWLTLIPSKLRATFDHTAAASEYLMQAGALPDGPRLGLAGLEFVWQRLGLAAGAWAVAYAAARVGPAAAGTPLRKGLLAGSLALAFLLPSCHWAWTALIVVGALSWSRQSGPARQALWAAAITWAVHAVFFGAGRYTLPLLYAMAPLTGVGVGLWARTFDSRKRAG
ncbi:MAG TPA: hypothetical protein VLC09_07140 [Polyangiaceae bacterium]|nr:hypothetical protein [Polyangiaceae bacterium]